MAVPASGNPLSMGQLFQELDQNDYTDFDSGDFDQEDVSLTSLSDGTEATINVNGNISSFRPDGSVPHAMSEFYQYDHDAAAASINIGTYNTSSYTAVESSVGTSRDFTITVTQNTTNNGNLIFTSDSFQGTISIGVEFDQSIDCNTAFQDLEAGASFAPTTINSSSCNIRLIFTGGARDTAEAAKNITVTLNTAVVNLPILVTTTD